MLAEVQEKCQKAMSEDKMARLKVLKLDQVNMTTESHDDLSKMNETCQSVFKVAVSQVQNSWELVKQVGGTPLNLSHWGYDVTSKAIQHLQKCIIHLRYRYRGVGEWATDTARASDSKT